MYTFYVEVSAVRLDDAFADHLRTSECGATALDDGLAALVANIGYAGGCGFRHCPGLCQYCHQH